jgi:CheY-like chemotaxis protein
MRILLVDDDEAFRATLRRLLTQGRSVQVQEAADGEQAVHMVAARPPDVVVMDITMPRMNGVEATRRLKARWPDLPVLILTVHDDPVYERTARAAGADGFLLKKTAGTALWPALAAVAPRAVQADPSAPSTADACRSRIEAGSGCGRLGEIPQGGSGIDPIGRSAGGRYSRGDETGNRSRPRGDRKTRSGLLREHWAGGV